MNVYFIAQLDVQDRQAFREYERGVLRTIKPYGGWVLAAGAAHHAEGDEPRNHNVIIRFPSLERGQAWWDSAEYRGIVPIRHANTLGTNAFFLPGLDLETPAHQKR